MAIAPEVPREPHELAAELIAAAIMGIVIYFASKAIFPYVAKFIGAVTPGSIPAPKHKEP